MLGQEISNTRSALFRNRNFWLLASGSVVSFVGDQFTMIALPWLVLKMTGDTLILGIVLVTMNVPRTLFLLIGGAVVDRYSAKHMLIWSQCINGLLLGMLAVLVYTGSLTIWMVYGFAFCIGLVTAFGMPSWMAIAPQVLKSEQLPVANPLLMGAGQVAAFSGPLLAGLLIALFGDGGTGVMKDTKGLAAAFLFDFGSFVFSLGVLSRIVVSAKAVAALDQPHILRTVLDGLRYFWNDRSLRTLSLYAVTISLFVGGPMQAAMPVLAEQLGHNANAFGTLVSSFGIGSVLGMVVFGMKPHFRVRNTGTTMMLIDCTVGVLFVLMGKVHAIWPAALIFLGIGTLRGFLQVMVSGWIQRHVAPAMIGRTISVFIFMMLGAPLISVPISGWLLRTIPATMLCCGSGLLMIASVLIAFMVSSMRTIADPQPSPGN
jgi:MFS family permease